MHLLFELFLSLVTYQNCFAQITDKNTFLYFAYGSNMLDKRIHIKNPSADFYSPAVLKGYRLDFNLYIPAWRGAAATIVKDLDHSVWGALWIIDTSQMHRLDDQEGVQVSWYIPINVTVITPQGQLVTARSYKEVIDLPKITQGEMLPPSRRPSNTYLQVMILGAYEAGLPPQYIGYLHTFPTNGRIADYHIRTKLGYPFNVSFSNTIENIYQFGVGSLVFLPPIKDVVDISEVLSLLVLMMPMMRPLLSIFGTLGFMIPCFYV